MKNNFRLKISTAVSIAVVLFLACFFFSSRIVASLESGELKSILGGRIFLQLVKNQFFVFSLPLSNSAAAGISAVTLVFVSWYFLKKLRAAGLFFFLGYAFILAGALCNLFSRLVFGFVWDFLNLVFFGLKGSWNLADAFIIVGILFWAGDFIGTKKKLSSGG